MESLEKQTIGIDNLEIILVADGFSSYYDVDIFQTGYTIPVITTQVDGYGDTIDISSLPDGNYTIVITSEFNNEFEGQFIVNWQKNVKKYQWNGHFEWIHININNITNKHIYYEKDSLRNYLFVRLAKRDSRELLHYWL